MSASDPAILDLLRRLWRGVDLAPEVPERALLKALADGASYGRVLAMLRVLRRTGLPGAQAARAAVARWPDSIDMARASVDLAERGARDDALAALAELVNVQNRRWAVLAGAWIDRDDWTRAQDVLARIDPASETAHADLRRRAEIALQLGDFETARADLHWLTRAGVAAPALDLRLRYRQEGAVVLNAAVVGLDNLHVSVLPELFSACLTEGDFTRAPLVLAQWCGLAPNAPAVARAITRLALSRGEGTAAQAQLRARLDSRTPWTWNAQDHLQFLRAGLLVQEAPEPLLAHAEAACRLHVDHVALAHQQRLLSESVTDWRHLSLPRPCIGTPVDRALMIARAALRAGLPVLALRHLRSVAQSVVPQGTAIAPVRAQAFALAGRIPAAQKILARQRVQTRDRGAQAELDLMAADLALQARDPAAAMHYLDKVEAAFPGRMVPWLLRARAHFQRGAFYDASAAQVVFNQRKQAQNADWTGTDLRDRIIADAAKAIEGQTATLQRLDHTLDALGLAGISASSGLSAWALVRGEADGRLQDIRDSSPRDIPRQIAHYWDGPPSPALARAAEAWKRLHPDFDQRIHDAESARAWLHRHHGPAMARQFSALPLPALRADLFRAALMAVEGGVFTDLDEYPRLPVTPWLETGRAVFCIEQGFGTIANNFMAAPPAHPVCLAALDLIGQQLAQTRAPYAWWDTGPAQWTRAVARHVFFGQGDALKLLSQATYARRVSTNLPFPHKRGAEHWR